MEMLVFRDSAGRATHASAELVRDLRAALRAGNILDALLRAGEIECALADAGRVPKFQAITDALALGLIRSPESHFYLQQAEALLTRAEALPSSLSIRSPEGF